MMQSTTTTMMIEKRGPCHEEEVPILNQRSAGSVDSVEDNATTRSYRRRRRSSLASAIVVALASSAATTRRCEAFASPPSAVPPFSSRVSSSASSALEAVRKRSGNRDRSAHAAFSAKAAAAVVVAPRIRATGPPPRRRKSNVFEQFTPEFVSYSPFDVDLLSPPLRETAVGDDGSSSSPVVDGASGRSSPRDGSRPESSSSAAAAEKAAKIIRKSNRINLRLRTLLTDDADEQLAETYPDDSPEAAVQLAEPGRSYGGISEEARRKASAAVSTAEAEEEDAEDENEEEEEAGGNERARGRRKRGGGGGAVGAKAEGGGEGGPNAVTLAPPASSDAATSSTRRRRVRATVKETGSDSISNYIKSLGQHELLFKEDEVLLGRQVRILTRLEERRRELEDELLRPPTFAQWAAATNHTVPSLKQQIRRSQRAKAALIEANLRLVITVARQYVKKSPLRNSHGASSVQFQDACQQGIIGLTRATEKFDPELGFRFSTYAVWWIQKEVSRNVSEQSRSVRVPPSAIKKINDIRIAERVLMNELRRRPKDEELAERVGMTVQKLNFYRRSAEEVTSLDKRIDARRGKGSMSTGGDSLSGGGSTMDAFVKDTEHPSPSEMVDRQMMKEDIRRLVRTLSPREEAVIRLRFGLDGGEPMGIADISAKFSVDKEKIKKIEARALLKLRQPGRSQSVRCYVSDHT